LVAAKPRKFLCLLALFYPHFASGDDNQPMAALLFKGAPSFARESPTEFAEVVAAHVAAVCCDARGGVVFGGS
jgi:hypothetical protein